MDKETAQRLQDQAVDILCLIEDVAEAYCDDNCVSGEQFYIMMKALVDCKIAEFPLDFDELEDQIYGQ